MEKCVDDATVIADAIRSEEAGTAESASSVRAAFCGRSTFAVCDERVAQGASRLLGCATGESGTHHTDLTNGMHLPCRNDREFSKSILRLCS